MKKLIFGFVFLSLAWGGNAQKNNTTNAALAYKSYQTNFSKGDFERAYADLKEAKEYIDKSAIHEDTKNDAKSLMYKGKIYIDYSILGSQIEGESFKGDSDELIGNGFAAFEKSKANDPKGRYEEDIQEYCQYQRAVNRTKGSEFYDKKEYAQAYEPFYKSTMFAEALGITDSSIYVLGAYSALDSKKLEEATYGFEKAAYIGFAIPESVGNLSYIYQTTGDLEAGDTFFNKMTEKFPNNKNVLSEKINYLLNTKRKEEAVKALNKAIELEPNNADYHFVAATVHQSMENYDKAEKSFLKTLELNPSNTEASFGLGGLYFNTGADLNNEANKMDLSDPNYQKTIDGSKDNFNKALPYLEKAHASKPDDKVILKSLMQLYGKLSMSEKYKEAKTKLAALKG